MFELIPVSRKKELYMYLINKDKLELNDILEITNNIEEQLYLSYLLGILTATNIASQLIRAELESNIFNNEFRERLIE